MNKGQSLPSRVSQATWSEQGSVPTKSRVAGGLSFLPSNPHAHANTHTHTNARLRVAPATAVVLPTVPRTQTMDLALLGHPGVDLTLLGLLGLDLALLGPPGINLAFLGPPGEQESLKLSRVNHKQARLVPTGRVAGPRRPR